MDTNSSSELTEVLAVLMELREKVTYLEETVKNYEALVGEAEQMMTKLLPSVTPILGMFGIDPKALGF